MIKTETYKVVVEGLIRPRVARPQVNNPPPATCFLTHCRYSALRGGTVGELELEITRQVDVSTDIAIRVVRRLLDKPVDWNHRSGVNVQCCALGQL
jgi:hypothetical protein